MTRRFAGVTAALVTPLSPRGEVAEPAVGRLISSMKPHVHALLPALSTGEGRRLTDRHWEDMVAATVQHAGELPVLAGVLRPTTGQVAERARAAEAMGAHAIVTSTPFGPDITQDDMYRHFADLAERTSLPLIVYNESEVSGNTADLATLLRVSTLPAVAGIKDSSGSAAFTRRLIDAAPDAVVLAGLEPLLMDSGSVDGLVVALANIEPELCADVFTVITPGAPRTADTGAAALRLENACRRYGLERDDWYRTIKTELHRRGLLETDHTIETERTP